jgi:hypothetical protein
MAFTDLIAPALETFNEILAAGIVIIAASLLLYNLSRDLNNRVARASGTVLATVTVTYIVDVFLSLGPDSQTALAATRLQWLGIAFIPSALFHLSDALLATTGLPSRGRRRLIVRILYGVSVLFLLGVVATEWVATPVMVGNDVFLIGKALFWLYLLFFVIACGVTFINVQRARKRCLTTSTARRMGYLQIAILTPAIGIFPFSAFLPPSEEISLGIQIIVNITNLIVITMLVFLSYPLSFFGSNKPDRVVKVELLRFLLRGPGTGMIALAMIITTRRASQILSLPGDEFMPFAVVAMVLLWQWGIHLALPYLEKWLIYRDEDDDQMMRLQDLSDRILTRSDLQQFIQAVLETLCNYLRTEVAFVVIVRGDNLEVVQTVGNPETLEEKLDRDKSYLANALEDAERVAGRSEFLAWREYYVVPLHSKRPGNGKRIEAPIGMLGIRIDQNPLERVDKEDTNLLYNFVEQTEQTLDDILLQGEIFAALEGLLPQIQITRRRADEVEFGSTIQANQVSHSQDREELFEQVRAAMRHYWGGPGISRSRLLEFGVVQAETGDTPVQSLRLVLQKAMEQLRPEGERSMLATDWTLYNILDLRFIEGKKVRDVARRMSLSEPDLYRKQRLAIEALTEVILAMENEFQKSK